MADASQKSAGTEMVAISPKALELLQGLGLVFSHSSLYGLSHSVTAQALEKCFKLLGEVLAEKEEINISVAEEELLINGLPVESATPAVHALVQRLTGLAIASFSLTRGISAAELGNVVELLQATPDEMRTAGGFAAVISALGLTHVRSKRVTIQQITEDEMVVSKEKLEKVVGQTDVENVVKYLRGDADATVPGISENLQACTADVKQASELVIQASLPSGGTDPAEEPAKIVEAVRRLYDNMAGGPAGQTQKGKKALVKFIEQLEVALVENMRKAHGGESPEAEAKVAQALEEMKDELRIDSLAAEYAKKRSAISASEKRILRYIETVGLAVAQKTGLKDRLTEEGLSSDEWDDLVDKSGLADRSTDGEVDGAAANAARAAAVSDLANSLSRLGAVGGRGSGGSGGVGGAVGGGSVGGSDVAGGASSDAPALAPAELDRVLVQVNDAVTKLVDQTERKIEGFAKKMRAPGKGKGEVGVTRRQIVEFLAEIVQELRQPLAVIMSVMDALKSGMLGSLTQQQTAMIGLAGGSVERLDLLITKLSEVSGMPEGLVPDAKILGAVYKDRKGGNA